MLLQRESEQIKGSLGNFKKIKSYVGDLDKCLALELTDDMCLNPLDCFGEFQAQKESSSM